MCKDDTIRYAIDHLMDEGFLNRTCVIPTSEIRRRLSERYDALVEQGERPISSRLANWFIDNENHRSEKMNHYTNKRCRRNRH